MKNTIIYRMKSRLITLLLLLITVSSVTSAQEAKKEIPLKYGATNEGKRQDPAMQKFRDNRLGAFIHWGLYAIPGGEWNGKVYGGAAEWLKSWAKVPADEWLKLMDQWNPTKFDAKKWVLSMSRLQRNIMKASVCGLVSILNIP